MRYGLLLALLPLAACGRSGVPAPVAQESQPAPAIAAPVSPASALLDEMVSPRQQGAHAPRDECAELPGATEFRRDLASAALARDADAVASMAEPGVRLGFGGDDGRARFREKLVEKDGALFRDIEALLRLGCAADARGGMTMPWIFAQDLGEADSYSAMLVTGVDVPLRATAETGSAVQQKLSWDIVTLEGNWQPDRPMQQVKSSGGTKGFVATEKLRLLLDYRLLATRGDQGWKISALVAGD